MRIESIEIKNFRQYRDEKFVFPKKSGKKDIHVIIGENGEGKTNILNALTWCLYGEELHLGDKNTAIRPINSQYVQELRAHGDKYGDASVIVEMSIEDGGTIRFMRTATFSITAADATETKQSTMAVTAGNGGNKFTENKEEYNTFISRYVPKEINEYIFFDGELMDQYFKSDKRENIENGIKDLTKATTIEKSKRALSYYLSSEIIPMLKNFGDKKVQEAQNLLDAAQVSFDNQQEKVGIILKQVQEAKDMLDECNRKIKGHENLKDKTDRLAYLEEQSDFLRKREIETQQQLIAFAREYYIYFALFPAFKKFRDYIQSQETAGNLPPKVDKRLIESIIHQGECAICGNKLDSTHLDHVVKILKKLEVSSITSHELSRASSALNSFFERIVDYPRRKQQLQGAYMHVKEAIENNDKEYKTLFDELKSISNTEEIKQAIIKKEGYLNAHDANVKKLGQEQYILKCKSEELDTARKELDKALKSNDRMAIYRRQYDFCSQGITILDQTIQEILTECREDMRDATFEIFSKLIWKKDAFSKIDIAEDYTFQLLDIYGEQTLGSCSAAERALLALSFTIALQQTSGHDSLLYIDTPLGRVGEKNRINFTQVLADIADSKQVILSFTPTEYDENVRAELADKYSSYSELKFENGVTKINR